MEKKIVETKPVEVIEMDELFDYIKEKKQYLRDRLVTRKMRQIVVLDVTYDKSEERIQKIVDSLISAKNYFSDANPIYQRVSYLGKRFVFIAKVIRLQ